MAQAQAEEDAAREKKAAAYEAFLVNAEARVKELGVQAREKKEADYQALCQKASTAKTVAVYREASIAFESRFSDYKDSAERAERCEAEIIRIEKAAAKEAERQRIAAEKAAEKEEKKRKRTIAIATLTIIACIAFVIVLTTSIIPKQKLNKALEMLDSGDYEAAYALLEEIGNSEAIASSKYNRAVALIDSGDYEAAYSLLKGLTYKDSKSKISAIKKILLSKTQVGSYVNFGSYEQDNNTSNGKEDIEWLVLAKEGNRVLLISRYALDNNCFCRIIDTWETCYLREWLNGIFLREAFSEEERAMIPSVTVSADKNPGYSTSPGNSTTDQVFLLSIPEANKYFSSNEARKCAPTAYAIAQGAWTSDSNKVDGKATCGWWLRSPGKLSSFTAEVNSSGFISNSGDNGYSAVRPALWVNLGS